eukprot:scaffold18824_cov77-Cyclotella_meneghiniana.AAC.16
MTPCKTPRITQILKNFPANCCHQPHPPQQLSVKPQQLSAASTPPSSVCRFDGDMSFKQRVPTGVAEDGSLFYKESDLLGPRGVKIAMLPSGDTPLLCMPSVAKDCQDIIAGNPTPITCSGPEGKKVFRCEHEVVPANPKTGTKPQLCQKTWVQGPNVNIGSILCHSRSVHWRITGRKLAPIPGQKGINTIFKRRVKAKTTNSDPAPSVAEELIGHDFLQDVVGVVDAPTAPTLTLTAPTVDASLPTLPVELNTLDHIPCRGIHVLDFKNINFPDDYDFVQNYPFVVHSSTSQLTFERSNLLPKVDWTIDSLGNIMSDKCDGIIVRDRSNTMTVKNTTSHAGKPACIDCIGLQYNQRLMQLLLASVEKKYGQTPNGLLPISAVNERVAKLSRNIAAHRLAEKNYERKVTALSGRVDDNSRLMLKIQQEDVPDLRRLMIVHTRNGGGVKSFIDKLARAAAFGLVGHGTMRRELIQRGSKADYADFNTEASKTLLMTLLSTLVQLFNDTKKSVS